MPRGRGTWASIISTRRFGEEGWILEKREREKMAGREGGEYRGFRATPSGVLRWVLFYNFIGRDRFRVLNFTEGICTPPLYASSIPVTFYALPRAA